MIVILFLIVLICLIFNGKDNESRRTCVILCGSVLVLFAGFRSQYMGVDTISYVEYYLENGHKSFAEIWTGGKDPGFYVFGRVLFMLYGSNYTLYLLTVALFFQIPISKLLYDYSPNLLLGHLLFMSMGFFYFSITGLRQTMAIAMTVWALMFLLKGSRIKSVVAVLIAAMFHKSAIVFLLGIVLAGRKLNKKTLLIYAIITVLLIIYGSSVLSSFLEFGNSTFEDSRFALYALDDHATLRYTGFIQLLLLFIFAFFFTTKEMREEKNYLVFLNMMALSIVMQSLAIYIAEMFRVAMYFSVSMIAAIPMACQYVEKKNKALVIFLEGFLVFYYLLLYGKTEYLFFWS